MFNSEECLQDGGSHAIELDASGFLAAPGETQEQFLTRVSHFFERRKKLYQAVDDRMLLDELVGFRVGEGTPVPDDILKETGKKTEELFGFHADWAPAFFPGDSLGLLWGGCTVVTEEGFPLFFIRKEFRKKAKWFIYKRTELLAHELCHAVRGCLKDNEYEEHFAYMTSASPLRRYMGNCFQHECDAILFVLPVFLLLGIEILNFLGIARLPVWPFWLLAFVYPAFLLIRNAFSRRIYFKAESNLRKANCTQPQAVLFRCVSSEIRKISELTPGEAVMWISAQADSEYRWYIIQQRFFNEKETENGTFEGTDSVS